MVFGEDHCGIGVDKGDKGRCRKAGEEATVRVQARDNGGQPWEDGCGGGGVDVERSGCRYN